jgi:hypothetical protein
MTNRDVPLKVSRAFRRFLDIELAGDRELKRDAYSHIMADLAFRLKLEPWEQTPLYLENKSMPELDELTAFPRAGKLRAFVRIWRGEGDCHVVARTLIEDLAMRSRRRTRTSGRVRYVPTTTDTLAIAK